MIRSPPGLMALAEIADESCHYRGLLLVSTDVPEALLFCSKSPLSGMESFEA